MRRAYRPLGLAVALGLLLSALLFDSRPVARANEPTPTPTLAQPNGNGGGGHPGG